ncbi:paramyosin [Drosophila santomea]|uniref:paramyosin n=1 Tax=Drosophila santomea TaxID=129105 RepID=UPI001954A155|nr:paramyosin [Drosophila santomea]
MTQQENKQAILSTVQDMAEGVERLVREQAHLKVHLNGVLDENRRLDTELAKCKSILARGDYQELKHRLLLSNNALDAARKQVEELIKERNSLQCMHDCSKQTIETMELDLKNYRVQLELSGDDQVIQRYSKVVKMLEAKVVDQQKEIRTQAETIKALHDHKQHNGEQLQQLHAQLRDSEQSQSKVSILQKQLKEYELSLSHTHKLLVESTRRETDAMRKVEEAIILSEEATKEKAEAAKLAEAYKEEFTQLANNIGTIMDEASTRVDVEVGQLKNMLKQKDTLIITIKEKLKKMSGDHKSVVHMLETRNNRLEQKYKEVLKQNDKLEVELEVTCRRLGELERSLSEVHGEDAQDARMKRHYESQMERCLMEHKKMKTKYREGMEDITQRFESEIYKLMEENSVLLAENELLKSGAAGDSSRQPS